MKDPEQLVDWMMFVALGTISIGMLVLSWAIIVGKVKC